MDGRALVERTLRRRVRGLDYLASPAPVAGTNPRERLIDNGTLNLHRYRARGDSSSATPVLMVMSPGSRGYVADLAAGNSLVGHLLDAGFDLFMIDWAAPEIDEKYLKIENYVLDFLPRCVARVTRETGGQSPHLVGYRLGGVLALLWAALNPERPLRSIVCLSTPVDFSKLSLLQPWAHARRFDVDKLVDGYGCCPSDLIDSLFEDGSKAMSDCREEDIQALVSDTHWRHPDARALRVFQRWMTDFMPVAGEFFRQTVKRLLWENRLLRGSMEVGGRTVDLASIRAPLLQLRARDDALVSAEASAPLLKSVGSDDRRDLVIEAGHAGLFLGAAARETAWPATAKWLRERS